MVKDICLQISMFKGR